jgi:hypothetical protein
MTKTSPTNRRSCANRMKISLAAVGNPVVVPVTHLGVKGRELRMNPRQIENRSNLANCVVVRNRFIRTK